MAAITIDSADLEMLIEAGITNRKSAFIMLNRLRNLNGKARYASRGDCQNFHDSVLYPAQRALNIALDAAREATPTA